MDDGARVVDLDKALDLMEDRELLAEIAGMLLEELPELLDQLHAGAVEGDVEALTRTAHRLKGNFSVIAAEQVESAARALEFAGKDKDIAKAEVCLIELEAAIERVVPALQALIAG